MPDHAKSKEKSQLCFPIWPVGHFVTHELQNRGGENIHKRPSKMHPPKLIYTEASGSSKTLPLLCLSSAQPLVRWCFVAPSAKHDRIALMVHARHWVAVDIVLLGEAGLE